MHKKLKKALMMEQNFETEEIKAEVIKLLCSGQDGSLTSKSDNSIQKPPSRRTTMEDASPAYTDAVSLRIVLSSPTRSPLASPRPTTPTIKSTVASQKRCPGLASKGLQCPVCDKVVDGALGAHLACSQVAI